MKLNLKKFMLELKESNKVECKLAKNNFPKEALNTYSAFANTEGGVLFLGIEEKENEFILVGVDNSDKIKKDMFDTLNNPQVVSKNLLNDSMVSVEKINEKEIIIIEIPSASYKDKPIYLRENIFLAYKRNHEGDYKCSKDEIKKMIRDSSEEELDNMNLEGFGIEDFDNNSIKGYRQRFSSLKLAHPFNELSEEEFLIKIGALRRNRKNKKIEATLGGMLVFGKTECIKEILPHFHLEFLDKSDISQERWTDRIIYDGSWGEGNLYNFFFIVIKKLYSSVKKPFKISEDKVSREENSKVEEALREAFVNSLIHADFRIEEAIKITKFPNYFEFENPGQLRITREDFFRGEHSKPRNNIIQEIFRAINLCERAGTGIPRILKVVREEAYKYPEVEEKNEKFIFRFWNTSEIENMKNISEKEKIILEYIKKFNKIANSDARENLGLKKHESIKLFNKLLEKNYIEKHGTGKGIYYTMNYSEDEKNIKKLENINEQLEKLKKQI